MWLVAGQVLAGPAPSPPPPEASAWQRELDAARLLEVTAGLVPAEPPAEALERGRRLAQLYRQLAEKYPDRPTVQKAAGDYFWKNDDFETAFVDWQRAQALDPNDAATASSLGSAYLRIGRTRDARAQFQRAVDAQPDDPGYHFELANVLYLFRREFVAPPTLPDAEEVLRLALTHFRRASELSPQDRHLAQAYAETFYILADPDWSQALAAWTTVRALSVAGTDFANGHLARVSLRLGKPAQAEGYLALMDDPAYASLKDKLQAQANRLKAASTPPMSPR